MSEENDKLDEMIEVISLGVSHLGQARLQKIFKEILQESMNGQVDGAHHKAHYLDQIVRIVTDCPVVQAEAKDCNGNPYKYDTRGESHFYADFVKAYQGDDEYEWEIGRIP